MRNGQFDYCPACTNARKDAKVFRCRRCNRMFCEDCCDKRLLDRRCPFCGHSKGTNFGTGWQGMGLIKPRIVRVTQVALRFRR